MTAVYKSLLGCKSKSKQSHSPKLAKCNQITTKLTLGTKRNGAEKGQISHWQYHSGKYPRTEKSCQIEERKLKDFPKAAKPSAHSIPNSWSELQKQHTGIRSSLILYLQHSSKSLNQVQKKWLPFPGLASDILPTSCNYIIFIYFLLFFFSGGGMGSDKWTKETLTSKPKENPACRETKEVTLPLEKGSQELCSSYEGH